MVLLLAISGGTCGAQPPMSATTVDQILGTWEVSKVTNEGKHITHKLELKQGDVEGAYEHVWEIIDDTKAAVSPWETNLNVEQAGKRMLALTPRIVGCCR